MLFSFSKILSLKPKRVTSIGIYILPDRSYLYSILIAEIARGRIIVKNKEKGISDINDIINKIPKDTHVCISIDGKGVIHKKTSSDVNSNSNELLQQVFPKASNIDFFVQFESVNENNSFISVIRKDSLKDILKVLILENIPVAFVNLGPFSIKNISKYIFEEGTDYYFNGFKFIVKDGVILNIEKNEKSELVSEITIRTETGFEVFSSENFVDYSVAIDFFVKSEEIVPIVDELKPLLNDFRFKRLFKIAGAFAIIFFLVILMGNFILFDNYNSRMNNLSTVVMSDKGLVKQIDSLQQKLKDQDAFIIEKGLTSSFHFSFYADRLAGSLPYGISLLELSINGLTKSIKDGYEPEFDRGGISITGQTSNSKILNSWIEKISKYNWIKSVTILSYNKHKQTGDNIFKTRIEIDDN